MKRIAFLALVLGAFHGYAQKTAKPDAFAKTITPGDLRTHLFIVAGPEMEGRETATEGQRKAAAYIENDFKQLGLKPGNNGSYQLTYPVYQDSLTDVRFEVNGKAFELDKDFNPTSGNIEASLRFGEVVALGADAVKSIKNENLGGKLVLLLGDVPGGRARYMLLNALSNKGVAGVLYVSKEYPKAAPASRKFSPYVNAFRKSISPQGYTISENVARALVTDYDDVKNNASLIRNYAANVLMEMKKTTLNLQSSDVIGILPGKDLSDQYVVISAHYDHLGKRNGAIYYGADDDGSGTVSVLEIAQAFAKAKAAGKGPRRSIIFLANSGEEEGLWGSDYYTSHPTIPLEKTSVDLNIDMIGRIDPNRNHGDSTNYVYVVGDDKLSSDLHPISEEQNNKHTKMELDYKFNDPKDPERIYYRSDHYNFAKNGVPIIFYFDGIHADYHRPTDTPDKINYNLMAKRAQLVFYTAWEMANRNEMLKRDIPLNNDVSKTK